MTGLGAGGRTAEAHEGGDSGVLRERGHGHVRDHRLQRVDVRAHPASWLGLHITLGGGFNTSQISQKPLGNHENPLFFMDFQ